MNRGNHSAGDSNGGVQPLSGDAQPGRDSAPPPGADPENPVQLTTVLENITDAFFSVDRQFTVTYVNAEAERLLRKSRAEMVGKGLWSLFPEALGTRFAREYQRVMEWGVKAHFEEFYPPLGQWYEVHAYPAPAGLSVIFSEITARKQMEDALRFLAQCAGGPGEGFFRAIARYLARSLGMDYVCVDVLETDALRARTLAVYVDGNFQDNVSYTLKDTPCGDVAARNVCCVPEGVRARYPKDEVLQKFGAESYVGTTLLGSAGRPIGLIAVLGRKPLTNPALATSLLRLVGLRAAGELERCMAEERLRKSEEFSRSIIENSTDCIKILDLEGRLRFMNEGGQRLLGIKDLQPYHGMLYRDFWSNADKPKVEEAIAAALAGRTGWFSAMVPTLTGIPKWWSVVVSAIRGQDGSPERLLIVSRDITVEHEAAREVSWLASFPEQDPNPIVEIQVEPWAIRYMNPAAVRLLPALREAGPTHPWFCGLQGSVAAGETAPSWREITFNNKCYRQEISRIGGENILRVVAFDLTKLKEAQRLLEEQPRRLGNLIKASQEMLRAPSVPELLNLAAATAARVTGARMAVCGHGFKDGKFQLGVSVHGVKPRPSGAGSVFKMQRGGVYQELLTTKISFRYASSELESHPLWRGLPEGHASLRGLVGARLVAANDIPCGVLMASDKEQGEFSAEDEALLVQLGLTASLALRHIRAKEQAERRATELDAVINSIADAVLIRDKDESVVFANPAASKVFGINTRTGDKFQPPLRKQDGTKVPAAELPAKRARAGAQLRGERFVYTSPSGREFTLLVSASPLQVGGVVQGTVSVWHDITEREELLKRLAAGRQELELAVERRTAELQHAIRDLEREVRHRSAAERALSDSEQRYRTLVEAAPVGIGVATYSGQVLAANRSLCEMFGMPYEKISGRNVRDFYATAGDARKLRRQVRLRGNVSNWQTQLRKGNGRTFDAVVHANQIHLGGQNLLLTLIQDVTAERIAQRHVEGIRTLLELFVIKASRAEYLEAVTHLVRDWSGCRCAGIRIVDANGTLPFAAQVGFNLQFLEKESKLRLNTNDCPCMRVLTGRTKSGDGDGPGVFVGELARLRGIQLGGRKLPCICTGYQSLAQVAIQHEGQVLGTLHLADRLPGKILPEIVAFLESVAPLIAEALHRFQVEQALMESERKFRALFEKHDAIMLLVKPEKLAIVDANPAACAFFDQTHAELLSRRLQDLGISPPASVTELHRQHEGAAVEPFEARLEDPRGDRRTIAVHCSAITIRREPLLFLIIHDVTERKLLQKRFLEISEEERQRVGQDLHDSLGGHLTGIALLGKALAQRLQDRDSAETSLATEVVEGLNQAVVQTRSIAHGLCPVEQNEFGFLSSLHEYAADLRRRTGVRCELHVKGGPPSLNAMVGSHLFRIVQEAVSNALAHAKAKQIKIGLHTTARDFSLTIWNDGAALPPGLQRTKGLGLRTMKYRASLLGAHFGINAAKGGGTVVSCRLPSETSSSSRRRTSK